MLPRVITNEMPKEKLQCFIFKCIRLKTWKSYYPKDEGTSKHLTNIRKQNTYNPKADKP